MTHGGRKASILLFFGDLGVFAISLGITLLLRYGGDLTYVLALKHVGPFSVLFILWGLVFFMSGLYGKRVLLSQHSLADAILKTQSFNILLAALFFFFVSGIDIAPKTNLIIYLIVSLSLVLLWRIVLYPRYSMPRYRDHALAIGESDELTELVEEVNRNPRYHLSFEHTLAPKKLSPSELNELASIIAKKKIHVIVANPEDPRVEEMLPEIFALTSYFEPPQFRVFTDVYEDVFDRIPLSELKPSWFLIHATGATPFVYALLKRTIDIIGGIGMGVVTVISAPIIWVLQGFEGPGPLFIRQERFGQRLTRMSALKFRSMQRNDAGAWKGETGNHVTKVGSFLRMTSLDEFPQFINILRGELSLIGPRNDISALGERLAQALPNYTYRYAVRPGITGWAQINQQYEPGNISPQSIEETKMRLAYDFYYLKHRSLGLDLVIALKTVKRMFFRVSNW